MQELPQAFCDRVSRRFRDTWEQFDVSFDDYARTTAEDHKAQVARFWRVLKEKGYIYLGEHQGWYSKSDEAFVPESQLVDVSEASGKPPGTVFQTALGQPVEWLREENYKFRLSAFREPLLQWLQSPQPVLEPAAR